MATTPSNLGQGLVRENWGDLYITPFYESNYVLPFFSNASKDCKKGDLVNVPVAAALTVGTVNSSTGALNVQTDAHTNVQIAVDRQRDVTIDVLGITREQAEARFESDFPRQAGEAMREEMETAALALYSDLTTTAVGDAAGAIGEDELIAAAQSAISAKLDIMKKPGDFCYALADNSWGPLRKLKIFDYEATGSAGQSASKSFQLANYGSVPVRFSTQVATSGTGRKSMLFHKSAFGWAAQREPQTDMTSRLAAAQWSYLLACIGLYGVKTIVATRGWVIDSKA